MSSHLIALALTAALSQFPNGPAPNNVSSGPNVGAFGAGEPFYPYDAYEPWVHGYRQEIPAYGGYHYYRPYNYRHVMPQSQVSAGWGMPATMPYSQGFYRSREYAQKQQSFSSMQAYYAAEAERQYTGRYQQVGGYSGADLPAGANLPEYGTPQYRSSPR